MADSGRQSPLAVNVLGSVLQNTGLAINTIAAGYIGASKTDLDYTFGSLVSTTSLRMLTWAINDGYNRGVPGGGTTLSTATYNNLISIGADTIPALGNSIPPTYVAVDPAGVWARTSLDSVIPCVAEKYGIQQGVAGALPGPATSGYGITGDVGQGQEATWYPYTGDDTINPNTSITQWGWIRNHALQAWNEFNFNGDEPDQADPQYKDFLASFMTMNGFATDSNQTIHVINNSDTFMDGTYSNMNDLISADISGISLSSTLFGTDLENLGRVIDLKRIETFGMPSNLLMSIGKAGATTQDLGLALLAAGLTKEEIASITNGVIPNWSKQLEQSIFGAFLIITGENLAHILAPLQCTTQGLTTLADLLNVQMMFPLSYPALTVPVYNGVLGLPTNSKTYYLIYEDDAVNSSLSSSEIQEYVGTIIPKGVPPTYANTISPENFNELPKGFSSYLDGVIPNDWAIAAGAFSYSIRQIKNIENLSFEILAKVAKGIENTTDLPLVNGTSKPTDQLATDDSKTICSLGSGQAGSYTLSDFFGSMSGLPYPWQLIDERLTQLDSATLYEIYRELFLAVSWQPATISVQYTTAAGPLYTVTGLTITDPGGGYGRGFAPDPTIIINGGSGATATCTISTDDSDTASNGDGTFGRVIEVTLTSPGTATSTIPTASIQCPPTSTGGGTNTAAGTTGWNSPMDAVVQDYIDLANVEIELILEDNPEQAIYLNEYWNILGQQLAREQRSRYTALSPVPVPKDYFLNQYPNTSYTFLDAMPSLSKDTRPHMAAQTIEAISDTNTLGGQSVVAKMREERNQARLQQLGIDPDNTIPNEMSPVTVKTLLANGTVPDAVEGITSPNGNEYTLPAWPGNEQDGVIIEPIPAGYYVPAEVITSGTDNFAGFQETQGTVDGDITPILTGDPNPIVNTLVPVGPIIRPPTSDIVIIAPPPEYNPTNLPPNLDPNYTNSTLLPSTLSISAAIEKVIECNCDCWVQ
jgi:hypothetical protein